MSENNLASTQNLQGKLLIAHPGLSPTNWFYRSVIYVYEHSHIIGATGLVLNMPSKVTVEDLCISYDIDYTWDRSPVYIGGPVSPSKVLMLHTGEWYSSNTGAVTQHYSISSDYFMFEKLASGDQPCYWRMFAGTASWAPGQLEAELEGTEPYTKQKSWLIAEPNDSILFEQDIDKQWHAATDLSAKQLFDTWL